MVKKKVVASYDRIGQLAFVAGSIIAILAGLFNWLFSDAVLMSTLFLLGVIVAILNVRVKETTPFLVAAITLILAGVVNLGLIPVFGTYLRAILTNIVIFVVPAAVVVALRSVWLLAEKR